MSVLLFFMISSKKGSKITIEKFTEGVYSILNILSLIL